MDKILTELNSRMQKSIGSLVKDLAVIRTGRATPALFDNIMVEYEGASMPLRQIASISTPETNLIAIQPWNRTSLHNIQRAILKADIGFNPLSDSNIIRVIIPPLSEERRVELARLVSKRVEEHRIVLRNMRRDGIGKLRELERDKEISQDELKTGIKQIDKLCDSFIDKANKIGQDKEKEIKEV